MVFTHSRKTAVEPSIIAIKKQETQHARTGKITAKRTLPYEVPWDSLKPIKTTTNNHGKPISEPQIGSTLNMETDPYAYAKTFIVVSNERFAPPEQHQCKMKKTSTREYENQDSRRYADEGIEKT